jgi:aerobic carbon-monoxide dehydrogenase medium subunit
VKPRVFAYHAPDSVDGVLEALAELGDEAKVLAGGQSLIPVLNLRLAAPDALVDLARVDGLDAVEVTREHVRVEARVTHERLRRHDAAAAAIPLLRRALGWVAHPAIRNRGTTVGSIAHGDPAAEMPAVLGLLGGHVELASQARGRRTVAASDYLVGPLQTDTEPDELALAVVFPRLPPRTGTEFTELARRHGDYALAGVGVRVTLDADHRVTSASAAAIGVGGTPVYASLTDALAGQAADALETSDAVAQLRGAVAPGDDVHATAAYRTHLVGVLLDRALETAVRRAAEVAAADGEEAA